MAQSIKRSAANPYRTGGPSQYFQIRGGTSSIPTTGIRTGAKVSVGGGKGGAPAAKGASAEAPKVPTGVEPGEPSAPEYNPIIDAETMSPPVDPNRQEAILNQARAPRFAIGNPNVGNIDLGSLLSAKPTEGFDPKAPIGGANVPFQETKGVGGFFRRMFGDTANEQNIAAQQAQAAEWKAEDTLAKERQGKREDLAEEIRLREAGPAERFKITQAAAEKAEAARVAAENKRLELEGERLGLTKQQIADARQERIDRLRAEKEDRDARIEDMRTRNALADAAFGISQAKANQPSMTGLPGGGLAVMDPRSGSVSIVNPGMQGFGTMPGTPPTTRQVYPQPKAPVNTGGAQVNRADGSTFGGPLPPDAGAATPAPQVTAPRSGLMNMIGAGAENVAGALGLEGMSQVPAALGDLITRDPKEVEKAARSRARYLNPSMQRTF